MNKPTKQEVIEQGVTISNMEEGHEMVAHIQSLMTACMNDMRNAKSNDVYRPLVDQHFELRNAKRNVQNQMTKLVTIKK